MYALKLANAMLFLSTLSLRRATASNQTAQQEQRISIHALLAESDFFWLRLGTRVSDFYPRSPCGERLSKTIPRGGHINFYPRSPCGERQAGSERINRDIAFLSTLSLRRATMYALKLANAMLFLSTLSLRRATKSDTATAFPLSFLSTLSLRRATTYLSILF